MRQLSLIMFCLTIARVVYAAESTPPNVLFIAVDDLRVELGCYGDQHVHSPNIDRLASNGTLFERAYCQQTVCNPSRASLLTGLRPDTLRVWDLPTHFRSHRPNAVTLPQLFKKHGYHTQCVGKIFHNWRQDDWKGDPQSWSVPSVLHYNSHGNDKPKIEGTLPPNLASGKGGIECRDVPDNAYFDGRVAEAAIAALDQLRGPEPHRETPAAERKPNWSSRETPAAERKPFFLAVGFWKPHTPFNAPKKYWDLYDRASIPLPRHVTPPTDVPDIALTSSRYRGKRDADALREMHHGHLAAISYLDEQVGKVLAKLDELGLRDNTIVVFWSDHGLHLGEHGLTRKTTAFELDARVPLIIATPKHKRGQRTPALVELLDLYPTLAEMCGLDPPSELEGASLIPIINNPKAAVKDVALTQTPRPNYPRGRLPEVMGYSIRTVRYRYTQWRDFKTRRILASELYDHDKDPLETTNLSGRDSHAEVVAAMARKLDKALTNSSAIDLESLTASRRMLSGAWLPKDTHQIDYKKLPRVTAKHVIISDVRGHAGTRVHQHAYLARYDDRFWAMWSDGPGGPKEGVSPEQHRNIVPAHDLPGTRNSYATSKDGLHWTQPADLSGPPRKKGFGWIARGLWQRDGELLALATHFNAPGYAGPGLSLEAFRWDGAQWVAHGTVLNDSMNNFPPKRLPSGQWMMTRRDHQRQVSVMIGGTKAFNDWRVNPLAAYNGDGRPEEPYWYTLPDGKTIVGLIRDNGRSRFLLRTFSRDNGKTWSDIHRTNFPDATSKFFVHRTSRGYYVMVSNSNPRRRDPLTLAVSQDGLVFTKLFWLIGGRHVDYPHVIEHDGHLLIAFSGAKQTMEVMMVSLDELERLAMPESVELTQHLPPVKQTSQSPPGHWIDLGDEGTTLYVASDLIVPEFGNRATLSLATFSGVQRVVIGIDVKGRLTAGLFKETVTGPHLKPGSRHSLLIRLRSHREKPDELFLQLGSPEAIPAEPEYWTLCNKKGSSAANLSRVVLHRVAEDSAGFTNVRIATTREALAKAKVIAKAPVSE